MENVNYYKQLIDLSENMTILSTSLLVWSEFFKVKKKNWGKEMLREEENEKEEIGNNQVLSVFF